jgi:hypothetical protein
MQVKGNVNDMAILNHVFSVCTKCVVATECLHFGLFIYSSSELMYNISMY